MAAISSAAIINIQDKLKLLRKPVKMPGEAAGKIIDNSNLKGLSYYTIHTITESDRIYMRQGDKIVLATSIGVSTI